MADQKFLDYEGLGYYDEKIKAHVAAEIEAGINEIADDYDPVGTAQTKIEELRKELVEGEGETAGALEVEVEKNGDNYVIKQGGVEIQTINIPKDMVVEGGSVVVDPAGQPAGTYIELVLANSEDKLYINVKDLIDDYTAAADAAQVQVAINANNEVSATLVAGGVGETELAKDAVTADKIKDGAVGAAELAADAVTAEKIADGAVGEDAIAADAITADKIAAGAITAEAIQDGAITADKLSVDAVQGNINAIEDADIDALFPTA